MRISAPLIVKNEANTIGDCIKSIRPVVDEVLVLDTGSTDGTYDAAAVYADRVIYSHQFRADTDPNDFHFAEARNEILEYASGDWVLSVDADEQVEADPGQFKDWLANADTEGTNCINVPMRFHSNPKHHAKVPRLFRRGRCRWERRYHDLPMPWDAGAPTLPEDVLLLWNSGGGDMAKMQRNIGLLRRMMLEERKIGDTTMQLADAYRALGPTFYPEAIGYYELMLSALGRNQIDSLPCLLFSLADCYGKLGCMSKALDIASRLMREYPNYERGYLVAAECYERLAQYDLAICYYQRATNIAEPMPLHPAFDEPIDNAAINNRVMCCDLKLRECNEVPSLRL